jgi:HD-GYP domain-containing protein (c-di-GMP phosphodiesterase class II)
MDTLEQVMAALRSVSAQHDPQAMLTEYRAATRGFLNIDRSVSLSRRDLPAPQYRITRSGIWPEPVNPWTERGRLPVLEGGLLGELLYAAQPRLIDELRVGRDDPAFEHLEGMGSLAAIPHFDDGEALNMVVHLRREPHGFDRERFPDLVLISGLFGRAVKGLVQAEELRNARQATQDHLAAVSQLSDTVLEQARELKNSNVTLEDRVRRRTAQLNEARLDAIYMLATASDERDADTGNHVRRIESYAQRLSRRLGYNDADAQAMGHAAILHDVGKLHIPDAILKKRGPLSAPERQVMQTHTVAGERILADRPHFAAARRIARSHHENFDGSGYPDGTSRDAIPIEARIVHVADVYDALVTSRPYKEAWPAKRAINFLREQAGRMFDPELVQAFGAAVAEPIQKAEG